MAEFPVTKPEFIVPSCVNLSTYIQGMSDYEVRCYYTQLVQQWATEWAQMQTEWTSQQQAFEDFKTYVNGQIAKFQSWFDNLDVQQEINNKIDEMVSDGTFLTIIQSTVNSQTQAATDAWLQENMTPGAGAPALDSSLTLENAAAQAKAAGYITTETLANALKYSGYALFKNSGYAYDAGTGSLDNKMAITAEEYKSAASAGTGSNNAIIYTLANPIPFNTGDVITLYYINPNAKTVIISLSTERNWNPANAVNRTLATGINKVNFDTSALTTGRFTYVIIRYRDSSSLADLQDIFISDKPHAYLLGSQYKDVINESSPLLNVLDQTLSNALQFTHADIYKQSTTWDRGSYNITPPALAITNKEYLRATSGTGANNAIVYTLQTPIDFTQGDVITLYCINPNAKTVIISLSTERNWNPANAVNRALATGINKVNFDTSKLSDGQLVYLILRYSDNSDLSDLQDVYISKKPHAYLIGSQYKKEPVNPYDYRIIFWGDSLTAGAGGDGTRYPDVCCRLLGWPSYLNAGVGGETAYTIAARQGADFFTVTGDVNGSYHLNDFSGLFGGNISPLRQGTGGDTVNPITINGEECTLEIKQASITDPGATYTISGYTGGSLAFAAPVGFSGSKLVGDINVIFIGQNGPSDYNARISIIKKMIAKTNGKCLVLGLSSGTSASRAEEEQAYLQEFGAKYFNTRDNLVKYGLAINNITPTSQDTTDIGQGTVPSSLRSDTVHLNADGYTALGTMLAAQIRALHYMDYSG